MGGYFVSGSFASYVISPVRGRSGIGRIVRCCVSCSLIEGRPVVGIVFDSLPAGPESGGRQFPQAAFDRRDPGGAGTRILSVAPREMEEEAAAPILDVRTGAFESSCACDLSRSGPPASCRFRLAGANSIAL